VSAQQPWTRRDLNKLGLAAGLACLAACARPKPPSVIIATPSNTAPLPAPPNTASSTPTPAAPVDQNAFPHTQPILSFATSPDGQWLATGAEAAPEHADEDVEGVALWNLREPSIAWTHLLTGGVGFGDQLKDGLAFSPDGRFLAANYFTNALAVLDVATGRVAADFLGLSNNDGAYAWCWADAGDGLVLFPESRALFTSMTAAQGVKDPRSLPTVPAPWESLIAFDGARAVLVSDAGTLTFLSRSGAVTRGPKVLPGELRASARSASLIALGAKAGGVVVLDRATLAVKHQVATKPVESLSFNTAGDALVVLHKASGGAPTQASVLRAGKLTSLAGALAKYDWMSFADGIPVAVSPTAANARVATVSPEGHIDDWALGASTPTRRLGSIAGATSLLWPTEDRLLALGPKVVAVLDPTARGASVRLERRLS
jgi:hypothetical protein